MSFQRIAIRQRRCHAVASKRYREIQIDERPNKYYLIEEVYTLPTKHRTKVQCIYSSISFHQASSFSLQQSPRHPRWNCSILVPACSFRSSGTRVVPTRIVVFHSRPAGSLLPNRSEILPLSLSFSQRNPKRASCL